MRFETAAEALLRENRRKHNAAAGDPVKTALHRFVDELHKTLVRVMAYVAALGGIGFIAFAFFAELSSIGRGDRAEQKSEWMETSRPQPAFAMESGDFAASEPHYAIRRHHGGGRKDVLTWGSPLGPERYLRIEIYRPGTEHNGFAEPDPDAVARAGTFALRGEATLAGSLPSKFGTVSVVDLGGDGQTARHCLGFLRVFPEVPLQIAGWHCDRAPKATVRTAMACALDQLALLSAGGDARLAGLFARADQKRTFCGDKRPSLAAASQPSDWLDLPAEPELRGHVAAR
jgi:hypothetical protein